LYFNIGMQTTLLCRHRARLLAQPMGLRHTTTLLGSFQQRARPLSSSSGTPRKGGNFRFLAPLNARKAKGTDILNDPFWNKGSAFTREERDRLKLRGLLPSVYMTLEEQVHFFLVRLREVPDPLQKSLMLSELANRNATLFHRVLIEEIEEIAPLVYTPTVGLVCQQFSHNFTRPRGLTFTPDDRGSMAIMMQNWSHSSCQVAVVTDGSRILGLGDLGANGMGIPIGKLALYCAYGGIAPHRTLPVMLDFGTDNEYYLTDPDYKGWRGRRLRGDDYYSLLDEFMQAVFRRYPSMLLQFEDFSSDKAAPILDKYRKRYLCFNDDIQGTGATVLAGVLGALRMIGRPPEAIKDLKVAVVGAGSAGLGVAQALHTAMLEAGCVDAETASKNFTVFDVKGLLGKGRKGLTAEALPFQRHDLADGLSLEETVKAEKPQLILGLSGRKGTISEGAIRAMAATHERPFVFPLSNPTSQTELTPAQAYEWTQGKAIVATGSPFDPVTYGGQTFSPSQCNNMYIFPGLGLGASVCGAESVPDSMLYRSAVALSKMTSAEELAAGRVFPSVTNIRACALQVGISVAEHAYELKIARNNPGRGETVAQFVTRKMYYPEYVPIFSEVGE